MKRHDWMPKSFVGWLNFTLIGLLWIRVVRIVETETDRLLGVEILFPVAPFTGWWSDYWPGRRWYLKVWRRN